MPIKHQTQQTDPRLLDTTIARLLELRTRRRELMVRRWELAPEALARIEAEELSAELEFGAIFSWLKKLEKSGNAKGCYQLAMMYRFGEGVKASYRRAYTTLRKGAEAGDAECALECGLCHERSNMGATPDDEASHHYYLRAARGGMPYACERLGWAFFQGTLGRTLSYPQAYRWFKQAEELGSPVGARMCMTILEKFDAEANR